MSRNVCARSADVLVHGLRPVPEDPEDFLWGDPSPAIGCNALACSRCGAALRQGAGWRLADGLGAEAMAALHGLDDWETHGGLLVPEPVARTWVCRCHGLTVTFPRALRDGGAADEHPAPIGWHCASHPLRTFPVALDGVTLEGPERITPDWVAAMLRGSPPDLGSSSGLAGPAPLGPSSAQPGWAGDSEGATGTSPVRTVVGLRTRFVLTGSGRLPRRGLCVSGSSSPTALRPTGSPSMSRGP